MFMMVGTHFLCLRLFISALYHETQKALIDAAQEGDPFISSFFSGHDFLFIFLWFLLPYLHIQTYPCVVANTFEK